MAPIIPGRQDEISAAQAPGTRYSAKREEATVASAPGADEKRVDLVFEGGGVKGVGLAGAFGHLDQQGYVPQRVAGTSAGAITAALVAAGYRGDELRQLVLEDMDFQNFADGGHGRIGEGIELLRHKGLHPGRYFEGWMHERLQAKGITQFGQLKLPDDEAPGPGADQAPGDQAPGDPAPGDQAPGPSADPAPGPGDGGLSHRLQVIASDVSAQRMLVLPRDAPSHLGTDPDELEIAKAVRMSMSIPIFFDAVVYANPGDDRDEHVIVDGGLLSNFPVWLFDSPPGQAPRWPTFGLLLVAPNQADPLVPGPGPAERPEGKLSMIDFLLGIAHTMMEAHDRLYVEQANYARTIPINTLGVKTTQFSIDQDPDLKRRLYQSGADAAAEFLKTWDFDAYIKAFRAGDQSTRRQRVAQTLGRHRAA
jgi:NTE family protein